MKPRRKIAESSDEEQAADDSGCDSDSSHASQHTNASDPVRLIGATEMFLLSCPC
jgi:hypothetical protein